MEETKPKKINFFKKIWYSIGKVSKYEEMRNSGVKSSIKYFLGIAAILALIMAIVSCIVQSSMFNEEMMEALKEIGTGRALVYAGIVYFLAYFIVLSLVYGLYIILIALSMWGVTKILKLNWGFKKSLMNTIYASTFSIIVYVLYLIITYFVGQIPMVFDVVGIMLVYIYIFLLLNSDRKNKQS